MRHAEDFMASPLQSVGWEEPLLQPRRDPAVQADLKRIGKGAPSFAQYFFACPWLARSLLRLDPRLGLLLDLDFDLSELTILVVSQENACRFCYAATRGLLRMLGMNEERVQDLERRLSGGGLDPRADAAVRFARALTRANPAPGPADLKALADAGLSPGEVRELVYVAASTGLFNRLATLPALPPEPMERMPDQWMARLMRPLMGRMMRNWRWRGEPSSQPPRQDVVCATTLAHYQGSPISDGMGLVLREMWEPTVLSRRAKALMSAVVARGLGCSASGREFTAILAEEGLEGPAIDQILANLGGPQLDPIESTLVVFARDTIAYEPRAVQRRTRSLLGTFDEGVLTEALGVTSMANFVCRMDLALARAA
jgi:AhpD family alkylhydroperoxidase